MPDHDGELACGSNGRDMLAAPGSHAQEEGPQRSRCACRRPGGFDKHAARMSTTLLGDASMIGGTWPGLSDARVQPEIAHEFLRLVEARHVADRRLHRQRDGHVDTRNGPQPLHTFILESRAGKITFNHLEVFAQPVELAQMPIDREALRPAFPYSAMLGWAGPFGSPGKSPSVSVRTASGTNSNATSRGIATLSPGRSRPLATPTH